MKSGKLLDFVILADMTKEQLIEHVQNELMLSPKFFVAHKTHVVHREEIDYIECELIQGE